MALPNGPRKIKLNYVNFPESAGTFYLLQNGSVCLGCGETESEACSSLSCLLDTFHALFSSRDILPIFHIVTDVDITIGKQLTVSFSLFQGTKCLPNKFIGIRGKYFNATRLTSLVCSFTGKVYLVEIRKFKFGVPQE